jgi:putative ABC transport system permease protein
VSNLSKDIVVKSSATIPRSVILYIAWRNLTSKKLRTFLTLFGVVIGIGAIFFLLSFGFGLRDLVSKEILGNQSVKAIEVTSPNSKIIRLDYPTLEKIEGLPHVSKIGKMFSFAGSVSYNGGENDVVVYGVDVPYAELTNLSVVSGRLLSVADSDTMLINNGSLESFGLTKDTAIGKKITVYVPANNELLPTEIKKEFTIVGVVEGNSGSELFIPSIIFESNGATVFSQSRILADDQQNVAGLREKIESLGLETISPSDTIDQINQIFRFINVILVSFGAIGMIVAILGMFNTLTISLLERTKEIGLMVALGGRAKDMRRLFVYEAFIMSLFGASIGIVMSIANGTILNIVMNRFAQSRGVSDSFTLFSYPWWLILGMIIFMVIVGMLVVYFPARRAMKINPIDALRRE